VYNGTQNTNLVIPGVVYSLTVAGLGGGANQVTLDAGGVQKGFIKANSTNLVLVNLTLINANYRAVWGNILVVENCLFRNNNGLGAGAAIWLQGPLLTINNSTFENNSGQNAVVFVFYPQGHSTVLISNSVFFNNSGVYFGGALSLIALSLDVSVENSTFRFNTADSPTVNGNGGAIVVTNAKQAYNSSDSSKLVVSNSIFESNSASASGGAIFSIYINNTWIDR